jgi:hypothetical protein
MPVAARRLLAANCGHPSLSVTGSKADAKATGFDTSGRTSQADLSRFPSCLRPRFGGRCLSFSGSQFVRPRRLGGELQGVPGTC